MNIIVTLTTITKLESPLYYQYVQVGWDHLGRLPDDLEVLSLIPTAPVSLLEFII